MNIVPPPWFSVAARVLAGLLVVLAVAATAGSIRLGQPLQAVLSVVLGMGLAVATYDVGGRRVVSVGEDLEVTQWFRTHRFGRDDIVEFGAARASLLRWDIVAEREGSSDIRLWASRMLCAGRRTRQRWLTELEAWRTWVG
ncbi:MAG: hypothetical protein ABI239_03825 [Aquihabitans sp.]